MIPFSTLWKFSRPHTIIGSVISILTLYFIVCDKQETQCISYLFMALCIGISCNIFIVGINQIADVAIDKINKPYLPIPSGALSPRQAKIIVLTALVISLGLALYITPYLFLVIALATAIGWAYSMPPFHLKQHHVTAALSITLVRGILLNACGFLIFNYLVNGSIAMPENVKILTIFIVAFSIVISWFKDLADVKGDAKYKIKTLAIHHSSKTALIAGNILVLTAYLFTIYMKSVDFYDSDIPSIATKVLLIGHIILFALFIVNAFSIRLNLQQSVRKFYKRFWLFFFAEYVVYLVAYTVKF